MWRGQKIEWAEHRANEVEDNTIEIIQRKERKWKNWGCL